MVLLDLLGRRQALRLLWELRDGGLTFRQLQERCDGASPSVINKRIGELREVGIVVHEPGAGYALTGMGQSLLEALAPLNDWTRRWSDALGG
jgi:DNA-binding HxlR family transcriptional regulator